MERESRKRQAPVHVPTRLKNLFHRVDEGEVALAKNMECMHKAPNIYIIDNFLNPTELDYFDIIISDNRKKFKGSYTESEDNELVLSEERTSRFIHLTKGQDRVVRAIEQRAADYVGLSSQNVEPLQIVSYKEGARFNVHHDAGTLTEDGTILAIHPLRLVTLFVYLNNLPLDNGCTEFPELGLKVQPQRGRALLFCNILGNGEPDSRVVHAANPVHKPLEKYGINIWISNVNLQGYSDLPIAFKVKRNNQNHDSVLKHAEKVTQEILLANKSVDDSADYFVPENDEEILKDVSITKFIADCLKES